MKPGKYVNATFTPEQEQARRMWSRALKLRVELADGMKIALDTCRTRADWHKWLDRRLDNIEAIRADALKLFPDVDESFVIASMTMKKEQS